MFRKILAAATTALVAGALSLGAVAGPALADGSDPTTPAATTDTSSTTSSDATTPPIVPESPAVTDPAPTTTDPAPPADTTTPPAPAAGSLVTPPASSDDSTPPPTDSSPTVTADEIALQCLPRSAVSFTYDNTTNSGVITVTNPDPATFSSTLCEGFYVTAAGWTFESENPWPQKLAGYTEANGGAEITGVGPGTYAFGYSVTCGQGDIYASFGVPVPTPTPELFAPNDPYKEVHLSGMGFNNGNPENAPTYMQTDHCATAGDPSANPAVCTNGVVGNGTILVDLQPGILAYTLSSNGSAPTPITDAVTPVPVGAYTVQVTAEPGHSLQNPGNWVVTGPNSWQLAVTVGSPVDCGDLPTFADFTIDATPSNATCSTSGGTITVGPAEFASVVNFFVDGKPVAPGKVKVAAGDHVVTGTPVDPANTVDNSVSVHVGSSSAICPTQLKTLALTGTDNPTPWVIGGLGLLQLGLALVAVGVVRRRMDNQSV